MAELPVAGLLFSFSLAALLAVTAGVLAFSAPARWDKRLLAVYLLLIAGTNFVDLRVLAPAPSGALTGYDRAARHITVAASLALVAFLAIYPARPRWRSRHGLVLTAGALYYLVGAAVWMLDKSILYVADPGDSLPGSRTTLLGRFFLMEGPLLVLSLLVLSAAVRARALAPAERRAAYALLPVVGVFPFWWLGITLGSLPQWAAGLGGALPFIAERLARLPGDCCRLGYVVWSLATISAGAVAAYLAWAHRAFTALAIVALGVAATLVLATAGSPYFGTFELVLALGTLHVLSRHRLFDTGGVPLGAGYLVAGAVLVLGFLVGAAFFSPVFGESSLGTMLTTFASILLGLGAAAVVMPRAFGLSFAGVVTAGVQGPRLAPYRAALVHELGAGTSTGDISTRLRSLRAELGVSEAEHALMEYALRGASGGPRSFEAGELFLGRYRVRRILAQGGDGRTFLCQDERVGREVVVKAIRAPLPTPESLAAVLREARAMGAVRHPNVVALYDVEQVGDEAFIVMEYAEQGSLADRLLNAALDPEAFRRVGADTLSALEAVHAAGMVHRDVKPSNLLLTKEGRTKLSDFGIAHIPGFETTAGAIRDGSGAVGTIRYMSPEQARGHEAGTRSDLFSAAAALYEAYTGKPYLEPKPGESAVELQMRAAAAKPFGRRGVRPAALEAWFAKALDPLPERRFASARAMLEAFERVPWPRRSIAT